MRPNESTYARHEEASGLLHASPEAAFSYLDDQAHLSAHMSERSWMMGGGRMEIRTDEGHGQRVGSRIELDGRVMGMRMAVQGVITEHDPPRRKTWQTVGAPRLLVIGSYRMGLDLMPQAAGARLRIFLDYTFPRAGLPWLLGHLFGPLYARWCTRRMVRDAASHFGSA